MSTKNKQVDNPKVVHLFHEHIPARNEDFLCRYSCFVNVSAGCRPFLHAAHSFIHSISKGQLSKKLILLIFLTLSAISVATAQDADSDGVLDINDWCPAQGGIVNALGCPFPAVCDTIETATISFDTAGMNATPGYITVFVLADSMGVIVDTSWVPQFTNVMDGKYMVLALDYDDDGSLANFAISDTITEATANCFIWSDAITYRICPAEICNDAIDNDEDGDIDCEDTDCTPAATVTLNLVTTDFCQNNTPILLSGGLPGGGVYSGTGVTGGNTFNATIAGIGMHTITYTYTDGNGCSKFSTDDLTVHGSPSVTVVSIIGTSSIGGSDGSVDITASGGLPPYSYNWSDGATTEDITGLVANTYSVTVTDACLFTATTSAIVPDVPRVTKYLYLTDPAQGLDRIDPVAAADNTTVTSTEIGEIITSSPSNGLVIWHENGVQTPQYRTYNGTLNTFGAEANAPTVGNNLPSVLMTAQSPVDNNEAFLLEITDAKDIYLHQWNGAAWTAGTFNPFGPADAKAVRTATIAYSSDGTAMLVWDDDANDNLVHYRTWNGSTWAAEQTFTITTGANNKAVYHMVLAAHPTSNEMILVFNDDVDEDYYVYVWNGSSWGNNLQLTTINSATLYDINVSYEQNSGEALVIFGKADDDIFYYRTWNGTTWSSEQSKSFPGGTTPAKKIGPTALAADPFSDHILLAFSTEGYEGVFMVWDGSAFSTASKNNLVITNMDQRYNISPVAVAFESQSGAGLGIVHKGGNTARYATWDATAGWSAPAPTPNFANTPRILQLYPDPFSDKIMLVVNAEKIGETSLWDGSSWGAIVQHESDMGLNGDDGAGNGIPNSFFWQPATTVVRTPTTSFTQGTALCTNFTVLANSDIMVSTYINITNGLLVNAQTYDINAVLRYGATIIATLNPATYNSATGTLNWSGTIPANVTIPAGQPVTLDITILDYPPGVTFTIEHDSDTKPSKIGLPTSTYINVDALDVYNAVYAGGSIITSGIVGNTVYIRSTVSDPFGFNDITGMSIDITDSASGLTTVSATSVATSGCTRTYEYAWTIPPSPHGIYEIKVTADEGTEGITHSDSINFTVYSLTEVNCTDGIDDDGDGFIDCADSDCGPTATAGSNSPICAGATLNLTESGGDATAWSWAGPNGFTSIAQNPTIAAATVAASGNYSVTITDANSCTAVSNISVTVNATPTVTAGSNSPICAGATLNLTESGGAATSWSWTGPNGFTSTSQNPSIPSVTLAASGNYNVTITDGNSCTAATTISVTVNANPVLTAGSNSPICAGATLNLSESGGAATVWSWTGPNGFTSSAQNPSIPAATIAASGNYNVTITNGNSCTTAATISVTVNATPAITAGSNSPVCAGATLSLTESGGAATSWSWTGPNSFTSTAQNPSIPAATTAASGNYNVTITDVNSCTATTTISVTVNATPTLTAGSNSPICAGATLNLTESGGAATSWSWTGPNGFTSALQNPNIVAATVAASGNYNVTITDGNSCTVATTISVTVNITPTVVVGSNSPLCVGDDINLTETGGDAISWSWTGPDGFTSAAQNPTINGALMVNGGDYIVIITDGSTCTATDTTNVVMIDLPTGLLGSNSPICVGDSLKLTETGGDGVFWNWSGPNAFTSAEQNPNIANTTALADGIYSVTITGQQSCTEVFTINVDVYDVPVINSVTPVNPTTCGGNDGTITVSATAGTGSIEYRLNGGAWQSSNVFNGLTAGAYILEIQNDNGSCIVVNSSTITLIDPFSPTAEITLPAFVCQNVSTSFTATDAGVGATYTWDFGTGATPATATGIGPHVVTYSTSGSKMISLQVESAAGCINTDAETYTVYALPVVSLTLTNTDACVTDAAFALAGGNPSGGTYSGPGVAAGNFNPATAGVGIHTITYTYTDANGCINTATDNIEVYALPTVTFTLTDDDACVSSAPFLLGGGLPAIGLYSGPGVAVDGLTFNPATAGVGIHTITYTVTDPNGCVNTATDNMQVYALPIVTLVLTDNAACANDGTLTLGGGAPVGGTYSGANVSGTTFNVAAAGVGLHTVTYTYTDANGCTNSANATVRVYALPTPSLNLGIDQACVSQTTLLLSGGSPAGGTYSGPGVTGTNFNPSVAGVGSRTITYTYTDGNGCINTATDNITVYALPVVSLNLGDDAACVNEATVTLTGGSPAGGTYSGPHVSGTTFNVATAGIGSHIVTYTYTNGNGCTNTATDNVVVYGIPTVSNATPVHLTICGVNNGSITITGTGGSGTYNYRINGGAWQPSNVFSGLTSGSYTVDISNSNGTCFSSYASNPVVINPPAGASMTLSVVVTSNYNGEDISCYGLSDASARATAANGTAPYTYAWSNGQSGQNLVNVAAGTYFVTATDNTNCQTVSSIVITQPDVISAGAVITDVSCFGGSDGAFDLNVTGGVNAFTYGWDDLSTEAFYNFDNTTNDQTGNGHHRTGLTGTALYSTDVHFGSHSFDFNGSTKIRYDDNSPSFMRTTFNELTIQMWIKPDNTNPPQILFEEGSSVFGIALGLQGGNLTGGVRSFGFAASASPIAFPNDGQWHHVGFVFDQGKFTLFLDGVMGSTITTGFTSIWIGGLFSETQGGIGGGFTSNALFNGAADRFYSGLMDDFSYHRDALNINNISDSFDDDGDRDGLPAGDYDVLITDLNGCNTTITVTINQPALLVLNATPAEVSCFGGGNGSIDLSVTGGMAPFTYLWSNSATTEDLSGLSPGIYRVTVTDDNNCTATTQATIIQPAFLTVSASVTTNYGGGQHLRCRNATDGAVIAVPAEGRAPYTYLWSAGATTAAVSGLGAGTYTVTITDNNGCTATANVTIVNPVGISASATVTSTYGSGNVSCVGATNGTASASASNGRAPYTYLWSNGQSSANAINLSAGSYTVTATDVNGCTSTASVTLVNPPPLIASATITSNYNGAHVSCPGATNGSASASGAGGNGTYTYRWSTGALTANLINIGAGIYRVTVTDGFGCTGVASVTLVNPPVVTASITVNSNFGGFQVSCTGGADGNITANAGGGVGGYTYQWARTLPLPVTPLGSTTANQSGLTAGTYRVTITDANGCTAVASRILNQPPVLSFSALSAPPSDCGVADGIILVSASGGTGTYQYSLSPLGPWQAVNSFIGLIPGTYNVYVRNGFGTCMQGPQSITVEVTEAPVIDNVTIIHPTTAVSTDGGILVGASGNGLAMEYRLNGVTGWQSSSLLNNLPIGTYTIEVRYVGQSCVTTQVVTLIAGAGVESTGSTLSFCSGDVTATQFVETYFIPGPENQLLNVFQSIYTVATCGATSLAPINPITTYVSIGVVEGGTIIHYDHWEDGYEPNLSFPIQATTEVWGDNNLANGIPPGYAVDILGAADIIILNNQVNTSVAGMAIIDYDGRDLIGSRGNLAVTRLSWADGSNTLFAGAVVVNPVESWGVRYVFPVGENRDVNDMFSYTGAVVMARDNGTTVNYVNNGTPASATLNKGESLLINGNIRAGDNVTASAPIQVHMLTGDECARFEARFYTLTPLEQWSSDYYNPVATVNNNTEIPINFINKPTYVHLYNPHASALTVSWETSAGAQPNVVVAANSTAFVQIPQGTGTHFFTADGRSFYAATTIDSDPGSNSTNEWGFALLPGNQLTSQITMVGFAPGANPSDLELCCDGFGWSINSVTSETGANDADLAIDDDINTFWQSQNTPTPHRIEINLGGINIFTGFRYTPRQDGPTAGTIRDYQLHYWNGSGWTLITSGTWAANTSVKTVYFSAVTAQRVRLTATSEIFGGPTASAAELAVLRPENSAPLWITADYPPSSPSLGNIRVCIDHDGDGGSLLDVNGIGYDESRLIVPLGMEKIYDPNDNDQTGTRIWVCDGSDAIIAGAYGQDPATASPASPAIDLGTGLPNGIPYAISKCADLTRDINGNGLFDECDEVTYTVMVRNTGVLPLSTGSINIIDTLASELTYINNSTLAIIGNTITPLPDDVSPSSEFPLDQTGYQHNAIIMPNDSIRFEFTAVINNLPAAVFVNNVGYAVSNGNVLSAEVTFPVQTPISPVINIIPNDTTVICNAVPSSPFQDTCLRTGPIAHYDWSKQFTDSDASASYSGEMAFDNNTSTYWLTGTGPVGGCSTAYGNSIFSSLNVTNPNNAVGSPNGTFAELYQVSDELTINLGETVGSGSTYTFRWRKSPSTGGDPTVFIYESSDGITFNLRSDSPYTTNNTSFFNQVFTAQANVRYLRLVTQTGFDIDVDAVSFDSGCLPGAPVPLPHEIRIDLGSSYEISGFIYTPRQDASNGRIANYQFYTSTNGIAWGAPVSSGTWASGTVTESDTFPTVTGRYIRLIALSEVNGGNLTAVAELDVIACLTATTYTETDNQTSNGSCTDNSYGITRTWTTTDYCGNVFTQTQIITVVDTIAPVLFNVPSDITVTVATIPEPPVIGCTAVPNVALGKTTSQSSTASGGVSGRAVDGNTNGIYAGNSVTQTANEAQPWWQVDLGAVYDIASINIYNRTDCCGASLSNFYILLSDVPFVSNNLATNLANPEVDFVFQGTAAGSPSTIAVGYTARYVRVQLQATDVLSIAEFEVFPVCISATDICDSDPLITFSEVFVPGGCNYDIIRTWTATDNCGNTSAQSQTISVAAGLSVSASVTSSHGGEDISCNAGNDGEATVTTTGGAAPVTVLWSNGQTSTVAVALSAGTYYVTATDALGCQSVDSVTLVDPPLITLNTNITSNYGGRDISCNGATDGSAFVFAAGGAGAKSFIWSNGQITPAATNLGAGTYTVTATDANGCTAIASVTLNNPPLLGVNITVSPPIACVGGNDGQATALGSGGTGAYAYNWSTGATTNTITGLSANTYFVTVTDANGCTVVGSVLVSDPVPFNINIDATSDPILCEGTDGSITVSATGGTGSYEFRLGLTGTWQTGTTFSGLAAGTHDIYIRNDNGTCPTGPVSVTLTDPIPYACPIIPPADPLTVCNSSVNIAFSVTPLPDAIGYFWVEPAGMLIVSGQGTDAVIIAANGVAPGSYDICVVTQSNCGASATCCFTFDVIGCIASIGDFVWEDLNEDGIQTIGEPGIEGVTVHLYDNTNTLIATTTSASDGAYIFNGITAGTYYLVFDVSTNVSGITAYKGTLQNIGSAATDSDINPATTRTPLFLFNTSLGDALTLDAGYILSCPPAQRGGINVIRK